MVAISTYAQAQINVFAGDDVSLCFGSSLELSTLQATISGDVSDGNWFSMGDGIFLPSGTNTETFSVATHYVPGANDQSNGSVNLLLVSDDPDGIGPQIEVSDMVTLYFQSAPALVCNNNINVTLGIDCTQEVTIDMLIPNPQQPSNRYTIALIDEQGDTLPNTILTGDQIGQNITFEVGHECAPITCWGVLTVTDNYAPLFVCNNISVSCTEGSDPADVGLPIPATATATLTGERTYTVTGWDACSDVTLTYSDNLSEPGCGTPLDRIVNRTWVATDAAGNNNVCSQPILVERISIEDVQFPQHLDNVQSPALQCHISYETDENGHPSTSVAGSPEPTTCNHLEFTYSDSVHPVCGGATKILRSWQVIDWCTAQSRNMNQIIKIEDSQGPQMTCPADMTASTDAYNCVSGAITLPALDTVIDCSDYTLAVEVELEGNAGTVQAQGMVVTGLPLGTHTVRYIATDACGHEGQCTYSITIIDDVNPHVVCDEFTKASITSNGTARVLATSFDDGSTDNCGIVQYQVAKMTDSCGHGTQLGDYVDFCCAEVGQTVMVQLVVTDAAGNTNACMVEVTIEDKIAPEIVCPSDITIACDTYYDMDDLSPFGTVRNSEAARENIVVNDAINSGIVGQDGWASDNCSFTVTESATEQVSCYEGVITRTFTVTDAFGLSKSCTQRITIQNHDPIQYNDIVWPADIAMTGCRDIQSDTSATGYPYIQGVPCGNLGLEYQDEVFAFTDSACVKILRTWTAIDWCQYDANQNEGLWSNTQIIKLSNIIAPTILNCQDTTLCTYDDDCTNGQYTFALKANDDCNDSLSLDYSYEIDLSGDGTIDYTGNTHEINRVLPIGTHKINWRVADACGNDTNCSYNVTVTDCKRPTPYCISSITTALMPTAGVVTIWASDFDYGSYDNCTAQDDLIFSFGPNTQNTSYEINCDSMMNGHVQYFHLDMYVTDANGNQDFCTVELVVYDNDDVCPNGPGTGIIKGGLRTVNNQNVDLAKIHFKSYESWIVDSIYSNEIGKYTSNPTYDQVPYEVRAEKWDEVRTGVSTIDLVQIQRHILGFAEFNDPLKIIASDINGSNSVSSSDVVALRKLILGVEVTFPGDNPPWKFIPQGYTFMDTLHPWDYPKHLDIHPLEGTSLGNDFTAIKMGDVNYSYSSLTAEQEAETRSSASMTWYLEQDTDNNVIAFKAGEDMMLDAWEIALRVPSNISIWDAEGNEWPVHNYYQDANQLKIIDTYVTAKEYLAGETIFTVSLSDDIAFIEGELYQDGQAYSIQLELINGVDAPALNKAQISLLSNPSSQCTLIADADLSDAQCVVVDAQGRELYAARLPHMISGSHYALPQDIFDQQGIYFISIQSDEAQTVLKYIHTK